MFSYYCETYKPYWYDLVCHFPNCKLLSFCFIIGTKYDYKKPFIPQVGLHCVRGCEIEGMLDNNGRVIEDGPEPKPVLPGDNRTYRVWLDCNQYRNDMNKVNEGEEDVYEGNEEFVLGFQNDYTFLLFRF